MDLSRVLILDLSVGYGGSSSRVLGLVRSLASKGVALAGLDSSAVIKAARKEGLPVYSLGKRKTDWRILSRLIRLIREGGFQVLDTQNIQSKFWGSMATRLTNTALVSTINSWYTNEHGQTSIKGKIYTTIELATNRYLDLYITVSEKDRQSLLQSGIPDNRIELIYNAVEIDPNLISADPQGLRSQLQLLQNTPLCLAVGRLVPVKGYDILIDAVKIARQQIPDLTCAIIGDGESKSQLLDQIRKDGLEKYVHLVGYFEREKALMAVKSCDIFVMPSRYEGTPIALLEAAALGRPIIASASGGIPELVKNEKHALLVPPEDSMALAKGLVRLCQDQQFAQTLGLNAQSHIQTKFSIQEQVYKTWNAYQQAWARNNLRNSRRENDQIITRTD